MFAQHTVGRRVEHGEPQIFDGHGSAIERQHAARVEQIFAVRSQIIRCVVEAPGLGEGAGEEVVGVLVRGAKARRGHIEADQGDDE